MPHSSHFNICTPDLQSFSWVFPELSHSSVVFLPKTEGKKSEQGFVIKYAFPLPPHALVILGAQCTFPLNMLPQKFTYHTNRNTK